MSPKERLHQHSRQSVEAPEHHLRRYTEKTRKEFEDILKTLLQSLESRRSAGTYGNHFG